MFIPEKPMVYHSKLDLRGKKWGENEKKEKRINQGDSRHEDMT